jgi:hypothetical protein
LTLFDMATYHRGPLVKRIFLRLAGLGVALIAGAVHAITPLGGEFQVNQYTPGHQYRSRMSMSPSGSFVVTWAGSYQDGNGFAILAQRFDSAGLRVGHELVVNSYTVQDQQYPAVSINDAGLFVVVWRSAHDGAQSGIFARRFDAGGGALGVEFQVNTYTPGIQTEVDVGVGQAGGFFVVWQSEGQDGGGAGIFARRHNASGIPQATEFQVNQSTVDDQSRPRIAVVKPSDLVAVWQGPSGAFGRRLGSAGVVGSEFQLNATGTAFAPALAPAGNGDFVAVWHRSAGVFARRFDSVGAALTGEFQVNTHTVTDASYAVVAGNGTDFVVAWQSYEEDGDGQGVFARRLDLDGPVGGELQVNLYTPGFEWVPSIGMSASGKFVVAWDSNLQDGSYNGVFARRFTLLDLATLDVDGDGSAMALTDGLLVMRFLFGFSGTTLTSGAVGANCGRCDASSIASYLGDLGATLDADGDGELTPLTDGLLILRFLFGFTGSALVTGAVDTSDCTRCDAADVAAYLSTLI